MTDRISGIRASLANVAYSGRYYPGDVEADVAYLLDRVEALTEERAAAVHARDVAEAAAGEALGRVEALEKRVESLQHGRTGGGKMSAYHAKDSWYFRREPDGGVRIHWGVRDKVGVTLTAAEWASVVHAVAPEGTDFYKIRHMHGGVLR
jgi:hypothetical protein